MEFYRKEERKFDIFGCIWRFIEHWRFVLLSVIVFAVLFGLIKYISDYRVLKKEVENLQAEEYSASDLQAEISAFSEEKQSNIEIAILFVNALKERREYALNASIMKLDANNVDRVILQYTAKSKEDINGLLEIYSNCILTDSAQELIVNASNGTITTEDVKDMVTAEWGKNIRRTEENVLVNLEESSVINFIIRGSDKENAINTAKAVKQIISEYFADAQKIYGEHEFILVSESQIHGRDETVLELQNTAYDNICFLNDSIQNLKRSMTEEEKQLLEKNITALTKEKGETQKNESEVIAEETVSISGKWVFLGIVFGLIFAIALEGLWWIAGGKLNSVEEWQTNFNIRVLGTIEKRKKHKLLPFVDRWIYQLKNRNKKILTSEEEFGLILSQVVLSAKKENISKIYLTGTEIEHFSENSFIADLVERLERVGITLVVGNYIGYDSQALTEMATLEHVILWEETGMSKYQEIVRELMICCEQDVNILGGIVVLE